VAACEAGGSHLARAASPPGDAAKQFPYHAVLGCRACESEWEGLENEGAGTQTHRVANAAEEKAVF
jgi:hypothetical protein